jgi:D-lactate dehydrogenase (cytochrome)
MGISVELPEVTRPAPEALAAALAALAARFGNRHVVAQAVCDQHAQSTSWLPRQPPDAVVFPDSAADVQDAVRICARHRVPVIAYGTGTSLEGQVNAPAGGVCIDMRDMTRILAVNAEDLDCVIEPGVTRKLLNETLRDQGLFFPIDPGAEALKVVRADGEMITTSTRAKKSAAGYDLTRLFIGSEGTLGIVTEITLKLHGIPESIAAASCSFSSVKDACNAVILTIQSGIPVARIELLDDVMVKAINAYSKMTLPEMPLLLLEFHGTEAGVAEQSQRFGELARECGGGAFVWTTRPEERTKLWQARHDAYWAARALRPGTEQVTTDVCVPISRLADCVAETQRDLMDNKLVSPIVGHVGDGNFHTVLLCDMNDADEIRRAEGYVHRMVERALAMGGTCTGEHGIGQGKQKYLRREIGDAAVDTMRVLKRALDPDNILNPGKLFPLQ